MSGGDSPTQVFVAVTAVLGASHLAGRLAGRLGQPRAVLEIVVGLAAGPTLLGRLAPDLSQAVFTADVRATISTLAAVGVVVFVVGVAHDVASSWSPGEARPAALISATSVAIPFVSGVAVTLLVAGLAPRQGDRVASAVFVGCVLAVTAVPVLAQILRQTGLEHSRLGRYAVVAAVVGDAVVWLVLAVLLAVQAGTGFSTGSLVAALALGALLWLVRRWGRRGDRDPTPAAPEATGRGADHEHMAREVLVVAVLATAGAALGAAAGIHELVGAFLVGLAVPCRPSTDDAVRRLTGVADPVLMPFFFVGFGLGLDLAAVADRHSFALVGLVLGLAVVTKLLGPLLLARRAGLARDDALTLGVLLMVRGVTDIVVLRIGWEAGLVEERALGVLTLVALVTTALPGPLLRSGRMSRRARPSPPARPAPSFPSAPRASRGRRHHHDEENSREPDLHDRRDP